MSSFKCTTCRHKPPSVFSRLKSMRKGTFSQQYVCEKCGSIYKTKRNITLAYFGIFETMLVFWFFDFLPFYSPFAFLFITYPIYLATAPLEFIKEKSEDLE